MQLFNILTFEGFNYFGGYARWHKKIIKRQIHFHGRQFLVLFPLFLFWRFLWPQIIQKLRNLGLLLSVRRVLVDLV